MEKVKLMKKKKTVLGSTNQTRSDINQAVQSQKNARCLKFWKKEKYTICVAKTKALSLSKMFLHMQKCRLSYDVAHIDYAVQFMNLFYSLSRPSE